ncbi:DUF1643 domain-containing protein [uncultured Muriicola sp.]|uniref:DUF1643 domain-containing protein n=1 Tax=uncultured Muriicola sp. TaxID=1583102 RepID=UPI00261497C9|nr:DUF1643 domain-containing protein [uncultured Muriicola sp.]
MVYRHLNQIDAKAIYSTCGAYRYLLTLQHSDREYGQTVCVIMQNPSIAGSEFADKSVQFLETLIFQKEYPEFDNVSTILIVNQFARIQTKNFKARPSDVGPENNGHIQKAICQSDIILIAWGKINPYTERQQAIQDMIQAHKNKMVLMTKKHPSRGSYQEFITTYSS